MVNGRDKTHEYISSVQLYFEYIDGKGLLSFRSQIFRIRLSPLFKHDCRLICGLGLPRMSRNPFDQSQNGLPVRRAKKSI